MNCLEFFAQHLENKEKCKELQKQPEKYDWQTESASEFSPCAVSNKETVIRQITLPIDLETDLRTLKPTALDDVFNKGLSLNRLKLKTLDEIETAASERTQAYNQQYPEKSQRGLYCLVGFLANEVRTLLDGDNNLALGVYDTALENDISHADIFHLVESKKSQRSIRSKLLDIAKYDLA